MSRFYGTFDSDCTKTSTKRGHKEVSAHVRGWDVGVEVSVRECRVCGGDRVTIERTGGSNGTEHPYFYYHYCSADCQK